MNFVSTISAWCFFMQVNFLILSPLPMAIQALISGQERTTKSEGRSQSSFAEQLRAAVKL